MINIQQIIDEYNPERGAGPDATVDWIAYALAVALVAEQRRTQKLEERLMILGEQVTDAFAVKREGVHLLYKEHIRLVQLFNELRDHVTGNRSGMLELNERTEHLEWWSGENNANQE